MFDNSQGRGPPAKRPRGEGERTLETFLERKDEKLPPNHIILITVKDAKYPINVEVIYKVAGIIGAVNRIVCFERGPIIQCMVEFDTLENASKARTSLHGCDIYNNCCTMKVEYSKMETLKVRENGPMSWDFTNGDFRERASDRRPVILNEPEFGSGGPGSMNMNQGPGGRPQGDFMNQMRNMDMMGGGGPQGHMGGPDGPQRGPGPRGGPNFDDMGPNMGPMGGMGGMGGMGDYGSSVIVCHNLAVGEVNCDRLFNLICQYGNVSKIFFMKTKQGCAMVEMGDHEMAMRVIHNLQGIELFGNKLQFDLSKQHSKITKAPLAWELPDGSSSVKDFFQGRLNRFTTPDHSKKNRIISPTKVIHFFNIPKISDAEVEDMFTEYAAPQPNQIKWVEAKQREENGGNMNRDGPKPAMGLAYFDSVAAATEALVLVNHRDVDGRTIKLCFSPAKW